MAHIRRTLALAAVILTALVQPTYADDVAAFYAGKRINLLISTGVAGGYDIYARLVGSHISKHIPGNPTIVPQNQPGAGGIRVLNYAYNQAPRDGTVIFTLHIGLPLHQVLGGKGVRYDTARIIGIGRVAAGNSATGAGKNAGVTSFQDAMTRTVLVGATQSSSNSAVFPTVAARILGAKIRVVSGYKSQEEVILAMERGEVQGFGSHALASIQSAHPDYVVGADYFPLFQWGLKREAAWADIPLASELAKNDTDKRAIEVLAAQMDIGRSYYLPPEVPSDRVLALRTALARTVEDPAFLTAAKVARAEIRYASGPETEDMIKNVLSAPNDALERLAAAMQVESDVTCDQFSSKERCLAAKKPADNR